MSTGPAGGAELRVVADLATAAEAAATHIAEALTDAVQRRGVAHWATTGGSTAPALYAALTASAGRDDVPWGDVHVWWGDERFVPYDDPRSNVLPLDQVVGRRGLPLPALNLHPMPTAEALDEGRDASWAATRYAVALREHGLVDSPTMLQGIGAFDVLVVGIGPDGHLLSVFPDSAVWDADRPVVAVPAPTHIEPHVERVTLHPGFVTAARRVVVVSTGAAKAEAIGRAWTPATDPRQIPSRIAVRPGATWFLDEAAASRIPR